MADTAVHLHLDTGLWDWVLHFLPGDYAKIAPSGRLWSNTQWQNPQFDSQQLHNCDQYYTRTHGRSQMKLSLTNFSTADTKSN